MEKGFSLQFLVNERFKSLLLHTFIAGLKIQSKMFKNPKFLEGCHS